MSTRHNKNKLRIALVSPQVTGAKNQVRKAQPPLGMACLAAVLEEKGYDDVLLIDAVVDGYNNVVTVEDDPRFIRFGLSKEEILKKLSKYNPDIIGISTLFSSQTENVFHLAELIKLWRNDVPIVLGGNHASFMYEEVMSKCNAIDYIICGEADYSFAYFVENYSSGKDHLSTPGLVWRDGNQTCKNKEAHYIEDLDRLPFPAWHLYDMEKYFEIAMPHNPFVKSGRVGCIITSRGCPQRCYFCSSADYFGHNFRAISAKRVVEMIRNMVDRYAIKELQIMDDTFTLDYKRVIDICDGIKDLNLRVSLPNAIRADVPKDRGKRLIMFKAMKEAGVEQFGISVEHGDQDFLSNVIDKRLDLREVIATCDIAHEAGILVHANFMMGFPFENHTQRQQTVDFARNLDADSFSISLAAPLPGTKMWDIVEKNNLFVESFNINRMVYVYLNIIPHDISDSDIYNLVDHLNRELNVKAQSRRNATQEKYKLFKGKTADGDRKYHFLEEELKDTMNKKKEIYND